MKAIVTFGEIMGRFCPDEFQRFSQSMPGRHNLTFAGAEANVAASIAMLGGNTRFVTALPENEMTDACITLLRGLKVDVSGIKVVNYGRFGLYFVERGANQRPGKVMYDRDYSSVSLTPGSAYDWKNLYNDAGWLHTTGITPSLSEMAAEATEKYLSRFSGISDSKRKTYAAMVSAVDDGVGRILDKLAELKIEENTIVIFLSDNGGPEEVNGSDNGKLREGKGSVYEGGFRVPFAIQYKARLRKGIYYNPVSSMDIFATMAALTNTPVNSEKPLDGVNLIPYLRGEKEGIPHETIYLRKFDQQRFAVRDGNYKLITLNDGKVKELYNLAKDVSETNNIMSDFPEIANRIDTLRINWAKQLIDPMFLGLIHTEAWQNKSGKAAKKNK